MPNVAYTRPEVAQQTTRWNLVRDCLGGQEIVKSKRELYLPMPNKDDQSKENKTRYNQYLDRAVFYNVTKRTLDGLVGQVFSREPVVNLPDAMDVLKADVDGAGVSLDQQAKKALAEVLSFGRCGLFADYPATDKPTTKAEQDAGFIRPTITLYDPWQIVNWRTITVGARSIFSLIVISEFYITQDDGFEVEFGLQYRVLRLDENAGNTYVVEIWQVDPAAVSPGGPQSKTPAFIKIDEYRPKDGQGKPLTEIPFTFIGSLNNDPAVDHAPLYDMAVLNVAHYRNSADYEEACFICGQPTPVLAGLTKDWVDDVLKGKVQLGSRAAIPLPSGGSAILMQASPNTMPKEAMEAKERQMVALGAKLVEQKQVQRTAAESMQEDASASSTLSTVAMNVSTAYEFALEWCAAFMGIDVGDPVETETGEDEDVINYELNSDFPAARMGPQELAAVVAAWQGRAIAFSELRGLLRAAGYADLDDEAAQEEMDKNPPTPTGLAAALGGAMDGAGDDETPPGKKPPVKPGAANGGE